MDVRWDNLAVLLEAASKVTLVHAMSILHVQEMVALAARAGLHREGGCDRIVEGKRSTVGPAGVEAAGAEDLGCGSVWARSLILAR